jgi:hypothetical protein
VENIFSSIRITMVYHPKREELQYAYCLYLPFYITNGQQLSKDPTFLAAVAKMALPIDLRETSAL